MKIYIKKAITFVAIALFTTTTIAQVKTKVFPENLPKDYLTRRNINKTVEFEAPPIFNQKKAANKNILAINSETDNQFALSKIINYNIINEGDKTTENGMQIYSVTIIAKGALNISLVFSFFELSEGDILSIYTKKEFTDSITSSQNNTNKLWATRVYQGSELNIVLKTSSNKHDMKLILSKINFGYKGFGGDYANVGGSATCHVNANCSAGNGWDNEKNSVAMILIDGIANCTGALVMNTCNTSIPYFLTANHCLGGNLANWVFQFQTLSTDCATNTGWREDIQFNGCVLRANSAGSDFALLQLNQTPSVNSGIYYSGWSNQLNFFSSTTILHHPQGDLMKISRDNNFSSGGFFSGAQCLRLDLDLGRLEGGSSGAPYYNQNHRIVAQHYGRPDGNTMPVCDITVTMGGRFDVSWGGGGTNATRLSNWLDPSGTGATVTNTTNVANLPNSIPPTANVIGYYTVNGGTTQYSITNDTYQQLYVPRNSNGIINFYITSATFPFYTWNYDNITSPNLQFGASYTASPYGYGSITKNIYLTANSGCGTTLRTYTFYIVSIGGFGKIAVYPNPTRDALNVTITKETEAGIVNRKETKQNSKFDKTTFSLSPINTKQILKKWTFNEVKTMNYNLYIKGLATGVYILTIERNGEIATTKVIIL